MNELWVFYLLVDVSSCCDIETKGSYGAELSKLIWGAPLHRSIEILVIGKKTFSHGMPNKISLSISYILGA